MGNTNSYSERVQSKLQSLTSIKKLNEDVKLCNRWCAEGVFPLRFQSPHSSVRWWPKYCQPVDGRSAFDEF
jgi:hypothetical protein